MDQLNAVDQIDSIVGFDGIEALAVVLVALTVRAIHIEAGNYGLTLLHWRAFMELAGRPLRLTELATRLPASMPGTSRLVGRLIERGFVTTRPEPDDRRAIRIALTDSGRDVRERVLMRRRALIVAGIGGGTVPSSIDGALHDIARRLQASNSGYLTTEGR